MARGELFRKNGFVREVRNEVGERDRGDDRQCGQDHDDTDTGKCDETEGADCAKEHVFTIQAISVSSTGAFSRLQASGLTLVDNTGGLQLMASTSEAAGCVEVMQPIASAGSCIDCFRTGTAVSVKEISESAGWPAFCVAASQQGFRSALATALKPRGRIIGSMKLFGTHAGEVSAGDAALAQALAAVATIRIIQKWVIREGHLMEEQLHRALDSRIVLEQANRVIANEF